MAILAVILVAGWGLVRLSHGVGAAATPPLAAFLGDSYTAGNGTSDLSNRWSTLVAADRGWAELNYGRGGTGYLKTGASGCGGRSYCPAYLGMLPEVQQGPAPSIVVVAGGQNDVAAFGADEAAGAAKIRETYAQVRSLFPQAQIVAVGPSSPAGTTAGTEAVDRAVQAAAAAVGARYISMLDPPVILPTMLLPDGQHVGDAGHRAIADRVIAHLSASP